MAELNWTELNRTHSSIHGLPWWLRWYRVHLQCGRSGFDPCIGKISWRRAWQPTSVLLPRESPWTEKPGRLQSMGSQRVGYSWANKHSAYIKWEMITTIFLSLLICTLCVYVCMCVWREYLRSTLLANFKYTMWCYCGSDGKESACNAGDLGSILESGRSPGEGNGNPLQYSCLENPMDRWAWWVTVHGVTKSWTWLSDWAQHIIINCSHHVAQEVLRTYSP